MRYLKRPLFSLAPVVFLFCLCVFSSSAFAGEPWWHVQQVASPTHISAAREAGEVQSLEGTPVELGSPFTEPLLAFELKVGGAFVGFFGNHEGSVALGVPEATAANVQAALEAVGYGSGNVEVSGGPVGTSLMYVKTVGVDLGVTVPPLEVVEAGVGTVATKVVTPAAPAGEIVVHATDIGDGPFDGASVPVKIADTLPAGLEAVGILGAVRGWHLGVGGGRTYAGNDGTVTCTLAGLSCSNTEDLPASSYIEVTIPVIVTNPGTASGENHVSVSGGGAPSLSRSQIVTASEAPVPFEIEPGSFEMAAEKEGGVPDTQAGSHPFQFTTAFTFSNTGEEGAGQPAQPRNLRFQLPAGLVGNAQLMPRCKIVQFDQEHPKCPADTAVGVAVEAYGDVVGSGLNGFEAIPVFNLAPGAGEPARFGFSVTGLPVYLGTSVRTGGDYGVTVDVDNITQLVAFSSSIVTFWGAPNSPVHNTERGYECLTGESSCTQNQELPQTPFLTLPDFLRRRIPGRDQGNKRVDAAGIPVRDRIDVQRGIGWL